MRLGGVLALWLSLPGLAGANTLTLEVWPSADQTRTIYCAITLKDGRFSAFEEIGHGSPNRFLQWYSIPAEATAFANALQSLIDVDLTGQVIVTSRKPPPFLRATWVANVDNATTSGIYVQSGTALPDDLLQAILTLLPGGPCVRHLAP